MIPIQKRLSLIALSTVLSLYGCGGGGGGSTSVATQALPKSETCSNGSKDYPACPEPLELVPAQLQAPMASPYAAGSEELAFFTALNVMRTSMGLGPLHHSPFMDLSAKNHTQYLDLSFVPGENFHIEFKGRAGFTGQQAQDRIVAAGYQASLGTEAGVPATGAAGFYILEDTVFHRRTMMIEGLTHVGMYTSPTGGTVINYGYMKPQVNSTHFVGVYPVDGQVNVPLTHYVESPNPFSDLEMTVENMCQKTGFPISLQSSAQTALKVKTFTLKEVGQAGTLPVRLLLNTPTSGIGLNTAFLVAHASLKPLTQYEVNFSGGALAVGFTNSIDIDKKWRFTTGSRSLLFCNS